MKVWTFVFRCQHLIFIPRFSTKPEKPPKLACFLDSLDYEKTIFTVTSCRTSSTSVEIWQNGSYNVVKPSRMLSWPFRVNESQPIGSYVMLSYPLALRFGRCKKWPPVPTSFFFFFFLDTSLLRVRVLGKGYWRTKWDHMPHFWLFSAPTMMILHNSLILHDLLPLPNVSQHLVLSWYTMSSRSSRANSRKQPITYFSALWIIQKCIFCDFWMIQHDAYHGQIVKTV